MPAEEITSTTSAEQFINNTAFRFAGNTYPHFKTEYISCPSCGRTLLTSETTAKIRAVTNHLKGVKIYYGLL